MEDYKTLYYRLFNKITDVIVELEALQLEAEDGFLSTGAPKQLGGKLLAFENRHARSTESSQHEVSRQKRSKY